MSRARTGRALLVSKGWKIDKMTWYKKEILSTIRKEITVGGLVFVTLVALSVVRLIEGESFVWRWIEPFSVPDLWNRIFWSALTFMTLGAALYKIYFYKILSIIFGPDRSGYGQMKRIIWFGLMYVNYKIFPVVIDTANFAVSIVYNAVVYIVYISPYLLAGAILGFLAAMLVERKTIRELVRAHQ